MKTRLGILATLAVGTALTLLTPAEVRGQAASAPPSSQAAPARDGRPAAPTGTAVVRGRVLAADSRKPLRRARIVLSAPELGGQPRTVGTDADGNYQAANLPAAQYRVEVRRSGYLTLQYGQTRPLEQGRPLHVAAGQAIEHVDFLLPRMSVIAGRITDELGDPVEGVMVMALRSRYWEGQRRLVPTGSALVMSDDAGQYRILGLTPGTYYVMAVTRETWSVTQGGVTQVMGYAPTYFPGSTRAAEARRVTVAMGQEAGGVEFSLVPGLAASVSGTAFDSRGRPFQTVSLREEVRGENFARFGGNISGSVAADGTFTLRNVTPGEYKLVATAGRDTEHPEAAIVPINVESFDVSGVVLTGSEGGTITGRIVTDTGAVPRIPSLRVTIGLPARGQADPTLLGTFRNPGMSQVVSDGTFVISGVFGRSRLRVGLPDGWMVRTIRRDGFDITDSAIELKSGETLADVEVVITNRVSTVAGSVVNDKRLPTSDATVLVFASNRALWSDDSRAVRAVRPDQEGQFQIKGLPAGHYLAVAVDYVEDGMWNDPDYLEAVRAAALEVAVEESGTQSISLKVATP